MNKKNCIIAGILLLCASTAFAYPTSITKTSSSLGSFINDYVTYFIDYENISAVAVSGYEVFDTVPSEIVVTDPGSAVLAGNLLTWSIGILNPGASGSLTWTGQITSYPSGEVSVNQASDSAGAVSTVDVYVATPSVTRTAPPTQTFTMTRTATRTVTCPCTVSFTPTRTVTSTRTATPTFTYTVAISVTVTRTFTASRTQTINPGTVVPSATRTPTSTVTPLCAGNVGADWAAATLNAAFPGRYMHGAAVFNDGSGEKMWLIAGAPTVYPHFKDVWYSTNGSDWTLATGNAAFGPRAGMACTVYQNKMWVIAGDASGTLQRDVWSSSDGRAWSLVTGSPAFPGKVHHGCTVFNNGSGDKMWVAFGSNSSGTGYMNDVWSSSDGATWTLATAAAPWSARRNAAMFSYNGKIWIIGGYNSSSPNGMNDVWSSTDGVNWTCVTAAAAFPTRYYHSSCVFDNKMWVIGGYGSSYINDAWWSTDGVTWTCASAATGMNGPSFGVALPYNGMLWEISGSYSKKVYYSCGVLMPTNTPAVTATFTRTVTPTRTATQTFTLTPNYTATPENFFPDDIVIGGGTGNDEATGTCTDASGNIYVSGLMWDDGCTCYVIVIYKYLPDGTLDASFGVNGMLKCPGPVTNYVWNDKVSIKCDASGNIVVVGYADSCGGTCADVIIYRFLPDGSPDTSFNGTCYRTYNNCAGGNGQDYAYSFDFDSTGKIVVCGKSWNGTDYDAFMLKCNADGSPDTTFAPGGCIKWNNICGGAKDEVALNVTCKGGKIYVTGWSDSNDPGCTAECREIFVYCYFEDGTVDTSFGTGGCFRYINTALGQKCCKPVCVTVTVTGKIIITGEYTDGTIGCSLACQKMITIVLNSDGTLDTTFNSTGVVVSDPLGLGACGEQVYMELDGKITVCGTINNGTNKDMCVWKFNPDGTLDTSFNGTGYIIYDSGNDEECLSILQLTLCRKIAAGFTYNGAKQYDVILWNIEDMCPPHTATVTRTLTFTVTATATLTRTISPTGTPDTMCNGTGCVDWAAATLNAAFGKRHQNGSVVFQDKMWVISGADVVYPHYRDSWWSTNGSDWYAATLNTAFEGRAAAAFVVFDDGSGEKIWMFGGNVNGINCSEVWNSANGADWDMVTGNAGWSPKFGQAAVVYNGKMWLIGGGTANAGPPYGHTNEVWSSADGINWTQVTASAAFPGRAAASAVVFDNGTGSKMWLIGGGTLDDDFHRTSDVWYSSDGANWTLASADAGFAGRSNMGTVVYNNEILMVGGFGNSWNTLGDVWRSKDGINWDTCLMYTPFSWRNPAALVYNGRAWIIAGADGADTNHDVWYTCGMQMGTVTPTDTVTPTVTPTLLDTVTATPTMTNIPPCVSGTPEFTVHLVYNPEHEQQDHVVMEITSSRPLSSPPSITVYAHGTTDNKPVISGVTTADPGDTTNTLFRYNYMKQTGWGDVDRVVVTGIDDCGNPGTSSGDYTKETISQKDVIVFKNAINPEKGERSRIVFKAYANDNATVKIYNKNAVLIRILFDGPISAGSQNEVMWDGTNDAGQKVVSGMYVVIVKTDYYTAKEKIAVVH